MTKHLADLKKAFLKRAYQKTIDFQFNCLKENIWTKNKGESIQTPLVLANNQNFTNFRKIVGGRLQFAKN